MAISTRAPLGELPRITSSTPLGWTMLLRAVPDVGEQSLRLLPLSFSAATVVVAYLFGRELRLLGRVGTGALTGGAALLVPAMLVRNDLKQYTADAFVAVLLLLLVARVESRWSVRRVAAVGGAAVLGMLISHAAAFTGSAAVLAVVLSAVVQRAGRRLRVSLVVMAGAAVGMTLVYLMLDRPHVNPSLVDFWRDDYLPRAYGVAGTADFAQRRTQALLPYLGVEARTLVPLAVAALVTLIAAVRRVATALTVPLMIVMVGLASMLRRYPFLDLRTSTFLLVAAAVFLAVGVAGLARLLAHTHRWAGLAFAGLAAAGYAYQVWPHVRAHTLAYEDVRSQVRYVAVHRQPDDVVLVSLSALNAFAYYSSGLRLTFPAAPRLLTGFTVRVPPETRVITPRGWHPRDVAYGVRQADELACQTSEPRVWIVHRHLGVVEARAFDDQLRGKHVETLPVGPDQLLRYFPTCA